MESALIRVGVALYWYCCCFVSCFLWMRRPGGLQVVSSAETQTDTQEMQVGPDWTVGGSPRKVTSSRQSCSPAHLLSSAT